MYNNKKRFISLLMVFVLFFQVLIIPTEAVGVTASAAIAIDHDTGDIFFEKNADQMRVPASLTKIMTTYIIFEEIEAGNLTKDSLIKVSPRAARMSRDKGFPMSLPLKEGASYPVDTFIRLIMLPSASASCYVMAEHISGSEAKFVQRMNETAKRLGMKANFKNSHGAKPHYTTARSMAILVGDFINRFPDILNYTSSKSVRFEGKTYSILNRLITTDRYEGADGFKTGTIKEAGYCLAATAKRDGRRVITVVLNSSSNDNRYRDSRKLLDLAFVEQKKADAARKETKIDFINPDLELRRNTEIDLGVRLTNVKYDYMTTGGWTVNGKVQGEFGKTLVRNGRELKTRVLVPTDASSLKLGFYINLPDGSKKEASLDFKLSSKEPARFRDIDGNWAEDIIVDLNEKGLLNGVNDNYFGVGHKVKRADFVTVLGRMVEKLGLEKIDNKASVFTDVKDTDYFNKYLTWAEENKIVGGYKGKFNPNDEISRQEAAVILDKLFEKYKFKLGATTSDIKDRSEIKDWALESVDRLLATEILSQEDNGNFSPNKPVYRPDLAKIMFKTLDFLEGLELEEEKVEDKALEDESSDLDLKDSTSLSL